MQESFIFNVEDISQQQICPKEEVLSNYYNSNSIIQPNQLTFNQSTKILQPELIKVSPLCQRQLNLQDPNSQVIVFDFDEEGNQSPPKNQNQIYKEIKVRKCKKEISKEISTQQQISSQKSEIKPSQIIQHKISFGTLQKSSVLPVSEVQQIIQIVTPIFMPKEKKLQTRAQVYIDQILFFPRKFHLEIQQNHKLTARKKIFHSNSLYYFFSSRTMLSTKGAYYVGYMQGNNKGTQYNIYTKEGINLAHIKYIINQNGPIESKIYLPKKIIAKQNKSIIQRYQQNDENILMLKNKKPTYSNLTKKYVLNLKGRAKKSSMKNCVFQFKNMYALIFGKQNDRHYALEFGHPFSQFTAFALCISNYEDKLGIHLE